jgi:hypothetical protein
VQNPNIICDQCGEEVKPDELSGLLIAVAEKITPARKPRPDPHAPFGLGGMFPPAPAEPVKEQYELCPSCAMAMMIHFKNRRLQIKLHGKVAVA